MMGRGAPGIEGLSVRKGDSLISNTGDQGHIRSILKHRRLASYLVEHGRRGSGGKEGRGSREPAG